MQKLLINLKIDQPLTPADLGKINVVIDTPTIVAISGRGPIWLYSYITHMVHTAVAVFVYDPRIGFICVSTHHPDFAVGDVLTDFAADETIDITF